MSSPYTREAMQARFADLEAQKAAIHAVADPLRANRDALVKQHEGDRAVLDAQIKAAEAGLGAIDDERGILGAVMGGYVLVPTRD